MPSCAAAGPNRSRTQLLTSVAYCVAAEQIRSLLFSYSRAERSSLTPMTNCHTSHSQPGQGAGWAWKMQHVSQSTGLLILTGRLTDHLVISASFVQMKSAISSDSSADFRQTAGQNTYIHATEHSKQPCHSILVEHELQRDKEAISSRETGPTPQTLVTAATAAATTKHCCRCCCLLLLPPLRAGHTTTAVATHWAKQGRDGRHAGSWDTYTTYHTRS